jgi:anti-sigma regulatory factor (Ser/Thr protein kinase)
VDCVEHELPAQLCAVGLARHWVSKHCAPLLNREQRDVLELLTSEVVANAVLHGGGTLTLAVGCAPGEVVVAVSDTNPQPPVVRAAGPEATGGRGVALVDLLAQAWGWEPHPPGKRVWFRLTDVAA